MAEQTQDTSIHSLLDQLQNSKDSYVRGWAADLLRERAKDNEQVLSALKNAAQFEKNKSVRDAAKSALRKSGIVEIPLTKRDTIGIGISVGLFTILLVTLSLTVITDAIFGIVFAIFFSVWVSHFVSLPH
jgi:hypothetical protein